MPVMARCVMHDCVLGGEWCGCACGAHLWDCGVPGVTIVCVGVIVGPLEDSGVPSATVVLDALGA